MATRRAKVSRPERPRIDYSALVVGSRLQAEADGVWYAAEVVAVSPATKRSKAPVKVRFLGYTAESDIWVGADRLRSKLLRAAEGEAAAEVNNNHGKHVVNGSSTRRFKCASTLLELIMKDGHDEAQAPARAAILKANAEGLPVSISLWVAYREWVDEQFVMRVGRSILFHRFAASRALGLHNVQDVSGSDTANVMAYLASYGFLGSGAPEQDLVKWLRSTCAAYDDRFVRARNRQYKGLAQAEEGEWDGGYYFVQLADPQLGMLHWDDSWSEEETMLRLAVQHVNRLKPRFLLISGDLVNAFPSGPNSKPMAAMREIVSFKTVLQELRDDIPVVLQPGNHDVAQIPLPEDIARYRENFGDDYFSFWVGGVFYVSINSQYYMDAELVQELREEQDEWLQKVLGEAKGVAKHIVILSHVPPFVGDEEEPQGWATWELEARKAALELCAEAGAELWLCGHFHGNAVAKSQRGIEVVVTSSCGSVINWTVDPAAAATVGRPDFNATVGSPPVVADAHHSGLRIVRVREDGIDHKWFTLAGTPAKLDDAFQEQVEQVNDPIREELVSILGLSATPTNVGRRKSRRPGTVPAFHMSMKIDEEDDDDDEEPEDGRRIGRATM